MRKKILCLTAAVLLSLCIPGCSEGPDAVQTPKETVTVLRWWGAVPAESGPAQVVERFNALDPSIQVEYIYYNNEDSTGNEKLDISLFVPGEVDVFASYSTTTLSRRIENGAAAPLNALLEAAGQSTQALYGEETAQYITNGSCYYLPSTINNNCILYNQTMFDQAGIDRPTVGWTYEEFIDAAEALTTEDVYGYYYPAFDGGQCVTEWVQACMGGDWMYTADGSGVNIDNPVLVKSFEAYEQRVAAGIEPDFVSNKTQKMTAQDMLLQGKAAMVFGPWLLRYVKATEQYPRDFVVGCATIPKIGDDQEELHVTSLTEYMSVGAKTNHAAEALEFILWYITEGFEPMIENGKVPATRYYSPDQVVDLMCQGSEGLIDVDELKEVMITPGDSSNRTDYRAATEINRILTQEFEKAFAGGQTAAEAIQKAQERAEVALAAAG